MKIRSLLTCLAGLVPALLFVSASAGAASPLGAHPPWLSAADLATGATPAASHAVAVQLAWPQQKVTASDWAASDLYGYSAALTSDTAFVGTPGATINGNVDEGAVYVYRKVNGAWTQVQKITPDDGGAYDEFGISISVSGNTLLVGSVQHGGIGAAYVFTLKDGNWSQTQVFTASDALGFGYVVALDDGTAVIGAPGVDQFAGAAYVFTRTNGAWSQTAELTANDGGAGRWFGQSLGISGSTILVGQYPPPAGPFGPQGAVYVFTQSDGAWAQTQKLQASDGRIGDGFGFDLALSGPTALISGAFVPDGGNNFGAAYVFTESDGAWSQTQKLVAPPDAAPYQFGNSVALHGNTAVVGSPIASWPPGTVPPTTGAAFLFTRFGGTWVLTRTLAASDASLGELFGFSVGLSSNGVLATTIPDYGGGAGPDAAYIFGPVNLGVSTSTP